MEAAKARSERIINSMWSNRTRIFTQLMIFGVVLMFLFLYVRAFLGTELSDEAYYVADAKAVLNGNIPYSYANGSLVIGFTFLLIPIEALYRFFVPDLEGIFVFTRLCFVTFKLVVWAFVFDALKRKLPLSKALLLSALIIPFNGFALNFSYNTVPELTMLLTGCILYDVIEQDAPQKKARLIFAGIMCGVGCFANPGWGVALLIFLAVILFKEKGIRRKIQTLLYFGLPVLVDVCIVVFSVSMMTSFSAFCEGIYRMFINPIPGDQVDPDKSLSRTLNSFVPTVTQLAFIFIPIGIVACFMLSRYYYARLGKRMSKDHAIILSITISFFLNSMYIMCDRPAFMSSSYGGDTRGFITFCYAVLLLAAGAYTKNKIILYMGLYQPLYALAEIIIVSKDASIYRFINAYTMIVPVLYILLINRSRLIRMLSGFLAVSVIVTLFYANFRFIYRDAHIPRLTDRVESGVFKSIYTTPSRAKDLPELEEYLNSVISEDESYSFRDNVPFAYLMVHKGIPCEIRTWDHLQYTAGCNSPAKLYDYYRRRDMIPDKIIYIDFGKDEKLSYFKTDFKYNDWVNAYYDLIEDVNLNETFFHIMVFQYNGTFDGDYQWWIDNYVSRKAD